MTSDQLRIALNARNPTRWTKDKLATMSEKDLRTAMRARRARGFQKADIGDMSAPQLRSAFASVCPGLHSEEELEALDEDELRDQLREHTRAHVRYYGKSDLVGMDADQLRSALHFEAEGLLGDEELAAMDVATLRTQLDQHRKLGYTTKVWFGQLYVEV